MKTPDRVVGPDDLVIPEEKLKAMRDFEKAVADQEARDGDDENVHKDDDGAEDEEAPNEEERMDVLRAKAKADYDALANPISKDVKPLTSRGKDTTQLKAGRHCLDGDLQLF